MSDCFCEQLMDGTCSSCVADKDIEIERLRGDLEKFNGWAECNLLLDVIEIEENEIERLRERIEELERLKEVVV